MTHKKDLPTFRQLMNEIKEYDVITMMDLYLEAKLGKIDVISEVPKEIKNSFLELQKWINGYGSGG